MTLAVTQHVYPLYGDFYRVACSILMENAKVTPCRENVCWSLIKLMCLTNYSLLVLLLLVESVVGACCRPAGPTSVGLKHRFCDVICRCTPMHEKCMQNWGLRATRSPAYVFLG